MKVKIRPDSQDHYKREEILRMLFMYEYQNGTSRTVAHRSLDGAKQKLPHCIVNAGMPA